MVLESQSESTELQDDRMDSTDSLPLAHELTDEWLRALSGDLQSRALWQVEDGGQWDWRNDGVHAQGGGSEWSWLSWQKCGTAALNE